jgi:hypothetical protein
MGAYDNHYAEEAIFDRCTVIGSTPKAFLVRQEHSRMPDLSRTAWFPKSISNYAEEDHYMSIPGWADINWSMYKETEQ